MKMFSQDSPDSSPGVPEYEAGVYPDDGLVLLDLYA
jgi:hypothetical protein